MEFGESSRLWHFKYWSADLIRAEVEEAKLTRCEGSGQSARQATVGSGEVVQCRVIGPEARDRSTQGRVVLERQTAEGSHSRKADIIRDLSQLIPAEINVDQLGCAASDRRPRGEHVVASVDVLDILQAIVGEGTSDAVGVCRESRQLRQVREQAFRHSASKVVVRKFEELERSEMYDLSGEGASEGHAHESQTAERVELGHKGVPIEELIYYTHTARSKAEDFERAWKKTKSIRLELGRVGVFET